MTEPVSFPQGDRTPPTAEEYALYTRVEATPADEVWRRPRVLALGGAALVAVLAAGIGIGAAVQGTGTAAQAVPQAAPPATTVPATTVPATTVPATTVPATTAPATTMPATTAPVDEPSPVTSLVVALDPATSQPTELRGPVILNTEEDTAAVPGGKFFTDTAMVRVPEGKWEISAPKNAKSDCMVVMIDLPYRDVQTSGFESPGRSQVLPLYAGNGIYLDADCRAKLVLAFND